MLKLAELRVYCADIGSVRSRYFGWARDCGPGGEPEVRRGGEEIIELADAIAADLKANRAITLGFGFESNRDSNAGGHPWTRQHNPARRRPSNTE